MDENRTGCYLSEKTTKQSSLQVEELTKRYQRFEVGTQITGHF